MDKRSVTYNDMGVRGVKSQDQIIVDSGTSIGWEAIPEWMYDVPALDIQKGVGNCGSAQDFLTALRIFYNTIENKSQEIQGYFEKEDWKSYTTKVHALKSSANIIGASELSDLAKELESAGNAGNIAFIRENTDELLKRCQACFTDLGRLSPSEENLQMREMVPADLLEDAYESLLEFAGAMDFELSGMVLSSLKEYRLPDEDEKRMREVEMLMGQLDWDGVKSILADRAK